MIWPLAAAAIWLVSVAAFGLWRGGEVASQVDADSIPAFQLSQALWVAVVMALVVIATAWLQHIWGNAGVLVAAVLVGLAEVHAAAASMAQLHAADSLPLSVTQWGVLAVLASSAAAKSVLAFIVGGRRYGVNIGLGLFSMVTVAGVVLWCQD